ncbi:MAG: tetratricopeptide repeat protein, partial [Planctomycetes bacterium]|nr:tetratricopeptide repeat protein [Planctomycetota bacterium]
MNITHTSAPSFTGALGFYQAGNLEDARAACRAAMTASPDDARCLHLMAAVLVQQGEAETALGFAERAVVRDPSQWTYHNTLAGVLQNLDRLDEAVAALREGIRLEPGRAELHNSLAKIYQHQGSDGDAELCFRRAAGLDSENQEARRNLAGLLRKQDRFDEALRCYDQMIEERPDDALSHLNRALMFLEHERLASGWVEYDWRWREPGGPPRRDFFPWPLWTGETLSGKTIFVHAEQGVGDEIMFASCYPALLARAGHCIFSCDPRLVPLLQRSFPTATISPIRRGEEQQWRPPEGRSIDYQIVAGDVPRYLRCTVESFPRQRRFLMADRSQGEFWRERLDALGPGLKVGIAWRAGRRPQEKLVKTTDLVQWRSVLQCPGVRFVNLQHGDCGAELAAVNQSLERSIADWDDFDQTRQLDSLAALIGQLDLVISVSNTTVHLAGGLGKAVWVLLPHCGIWRWSLGRDRSLWYANAVQIRRRPDDDAQELLGRVADELGRVVGGGACVAGPHFDVGREGRKERGKEGEREGRREGER